LSGVSWVRERSINRDADKAPTFCVCEQNKRDKKDPGNSYRYEIWLRGLDRAKADDIRNRIVEVINSDTGSSRAAWTPIDFVYKKH
jgi:hypothetical protein